MLRILRAVAWIRRRVPYGILKNITCSVEGWLGHLLADSRPHFTVERMIRESGAWFGGKDPRFHLRDFIKFMRSMEDR